MDFPDSIQLKVLEKTYDGYQDMINLWETIDDLVIGGNRLKQKKTEYIKPIPGEDNKIYQKRLDKFTYENVIGTAISELTRKLSTGTVNVLNLPEDENNIFHQFWTDFRSDVDNSGKNEHKLIENIFQFLINYGCVYLHVEQSGQSTGNVLTDIQENLTPYLNIYHPSIVTNKGVKDGEKWYKLRFTEVFNDPFTDSKKLEKISWLFITDKNSAEYSGIFEVNDTGSITGVYINGTVVPIMPEFSVTLNSEPGIINHGFLDNPLIEYKVDDQYWLSNNAHLRQLEHLRELNAKHDMNTMLYIQRSFKPRVQTEDDLEYVSDEVDSGIKSGNPYILDVENFAFNEPSGSASTTLLNSLETTTTDIRRLYGLGPKETSKGALERSGASKEMDFISVRDILESIGADIIDLLNVSYNLIGYAIGYNEEIIVTGLDNFEVSLLTSDIENALRVQEIETSVSPTALTLFYQRISHELSPSATPTQKMMIDKEVENIFSASISLSRSGDLDNSTRDDKEQK